jgi:hypothetical protein
MRLIALIIVFSLMQISSGFSQKAKDRSGFSYGGGFGMMMASGKNALFYNGANDKPNAVINVIGNPVESYNSTTLSPQSQFYNVIKDSIVGIQYPSKMSYNPAVTLHGYLAYRFENQNSIYGQIKYSKCNTNGVFSIELASPDTSKFNNSANKIVEGGLKASENRVDIEIGYHLIINKSNKIMPFIDFFVNLNTVQVKSDQMNVTTANGTFTSSLIHYTVSNQYSNQGQGGTGYGFGSTIGIEAPLKDRMYYNIGLQGTMKTIHLLDNAPLTPHIDLFARVLF